MTEQTVKAMSDEELIQVISWAQAEQARAEKRKSETVAKIRELARSIDVGVKISARPGTPTSPGTSKRPNSSK